MEDSTENKYYILINRADGTEEKIGSYHRLEEASEASKDIFKGLQERDILSIYYEVDWWHRKRGDRDHLIDCKVKH